MMPSTSTTLTVPDREIQFASYQGAVLVSPSYRLLPEATGSDILCDISEFWAWAHSHLPAAVSEIWPNVTIDLTRIAAGGESAGGYLALQSAFLFPEMAIRLVMAQYPTLDISDPKFHSGPSQTPSKASLVDEYLKRLEPGAIRLSSPFPEKLELMMAILDEGRLPGLLGHDERMVLSTSMERSKRLPAIWIVQGKNDQLVSSERSFLCHTPDH
jgi:acetyl esterase/lipase